ncbi:MAG: hypothetical protein J0L69_09455 [Bacteroidetes bacterium]|nr:hypothetical protein [Bacteroidota bacterium]
MGKFIWIFICLFFSFITKAQNDISACEFDLAFMEEVIPDKEITNLNFKEDIKGRKIKSIKIDSFRKYKLDSIYSVDRPYFDFLIKEPLALHHMDYSFTRVFRYNDLGYCTYYGIYPMTKLFTKEDSINYNQNFRIEFIVKGDTHIVSELYKNSINTKRAYIKGRIMYFINNEDCLVMKNALNDSMLIDEKQVLYKYIYKGDKLNKVFRNGLLYKEITYPNSTTIKVKCNYDFGFKDSIEAESITKFKNGKIISVNFYYTQNHKDLRSWIINYDEFGYCTNINRVNKYFDSSDEEIIRFKNTYKNSKLIVSEPKSYYPGYGESTKNTFYENGLLKSRESELGIDTYEYTFYD